MATLGKQSLEILATAHPDLQKVVKEAIKHYDFKVLYGTRSIEEQFSLYKQGRKLEGGIWKKVGATVTNIDGIKVLSKHNHSPSLAVDLAPYPIDWNDLDRFKELGKVMKQAAIKCGVKNMTWGGDWTRFVDLPHFELK